MGNLALAGEVISATPQDIVSFLIWKDNFGRTKIHREGCQFFCTKVKSACSCLRRLAFGQVDCMIGKLSSIFSAAGRGGDDSTIPGHGNPAASRVVKDYLAAMRVEQLEARIVPTQADPIFVRFCHHLYDYKRYWTPLGPIAIMSINDILSTYQSRATQIFESNFNSGAK